jgi:hypothetical protein
MKFLAYGRFILRSCIEYSTAQMGSRIQLVIPAKSGIQAVSLGSGCHRNNASRRWSSYCVDLSFGHNQIARSCELLPLPFKPCKLISALLCAPLTGCWRSFLITSGMHHASGDDTRNFGEEFGAGQMIAGPPYGGREESPGSAGQGAG